MNEIIKYLFSLTLKAKILSCSGSIRNYDELLSWESVTNQRVEERTTLTESALLNENFIMCWTK